MKILVTGNCQARPLSNLLMQHTEYELLEPIILHLSKAADKDAHMERIAQADLVLAQATAPVFQPEHLRSDVLQNTKTRRVIVWPNVFFAGQHPYLRYLTHNKAGRIIGPMEATHDMRVVNAWFESRLGTAFNADLQAHGYEQKVYETAMRDLGAREAGCDIVVSDLIAENFETRQLFFTFNHPSAWLLHRLSERVLARLGIEHRIQENGDGEPLGQYRPPWRFASGEPLQGRDVDLSVKSTVSLGPARAYTQSEFEATCFACYDHLAEHMKIEDLRMTPNY